MTDYVMEEIDMLSYSSTSWHLEQDEYFEYEVDELIAIRMPKNSASQLFHVAY